MVVIGITGSIGMGKTIVGKMFRTQGIPVFDADKAIHRLFSENHIKNKIAELFPKALVSGKIDRRILMSHILNSPEDLFILEDILHPKVWEMAYQFIDRHNRNHTPIIALDIPLLFEVGGEVLCDATVVATAPAAIQQARVLRRSGMTPEHFKTFLTRQMDDAEKRSRADFLIYTGLSRREIYNQVNGIITSLQPTKRHS